ncbi:TY1B-OR, partial [Symbiodinium sp. CCMP2592]
MCEEIGNLEKCKTGKIIGSAGVQKLKEQHPKMRLIPARWVCARKTETKVRSRIVAKDLAHGSARKAGFSSPTPSHDAFMLTLIMMAVHNLAGCGLDVSHAFMHSPLTSKVPIVLKMPLSVSLPDGSPAYFLLYAALNGLRDASQAWLYLLSELIKPLHLLSDEREPCLFTGWLEPEGDCPGGRAIVLCYVDDVLVISDSASVERRIIAAIQSRVPVKITGRIHQDINGGGSITFIGRIIRRWPGTSTVEVFVRTDYLVPCWEAYQIKKGSSAFPNIAVLLEEHANSKPLSPEAYSSFFRAWMINDLVFVSSLTLLT